MHTRWQRLTIWDKIALVIALILFVATAPNWVIYLVVITLILYKVK